MEAERAERAPDQLGISARRASAHADRDDPIAMAHAEGAERAEPEQVLELVLEPRAPDRERLTRAAAGADGEQRLRIVAARQRLHRARLAHGRLVAERNQLQVGGAPDVAWVEAVAVEQLPVERHRLVGVHDQTPKTGVLPGAELGAGRARMTPRGREGRSDLGPASGHPTAFSVVGAVAAVRAAEGGRPSSSRARTGSARRRPKLSVMSATRSTSPWLVASSPRSKPW